MRVRLSPLVFLAVGGCQQDPQVPKQDLDPVSITLTVSTQKLQLGQPDTLKVVAKNNLTTTVRLTFPSTCQVYFTVRSQGGDLVTPRDGPSQCFPVASTMLLAANATQTFTTIWTGGFDFKPPDTPTRVPPGVYYVYAALIANGYSTTAAPYKVEVQ